MEARRSIEFLNSKRNETLVVSLDDVFARLIEEQTKTMMLANVSDDYVFQVVQPPIVSEKKIEPRRSFVVILGGILGMFGSLVLNLFIAYNDRDTSA